MLAHLTHARHEPPDALVKRGAIHQPAGRVVLESFERLKGARRHGPDDCRKRTKTDEQESLPRGASLGLISPRPVAFRTASRLGNWISVSRRRRERQRLATGKPGLRERTVARCYPTRTLVGVRSQQTHLEFIEREPTSAVGARKMLSQTQKRAHRRVRSRCCHAPAVLVDVGDRKQRRAVASASSSGFTPKPSNCSGEVSAITAKTERM